MPQPSTRLGYYSEGPLRTTPSGRRPVLRVVVRREEAGPLLRTPASLVARAPMAGARGSQPVGSLVTKASVPLKPPLKVVSKAPGVVG
jgi:hypothetical protein